MIGEIASKKKCSGGEGVNTGKLGCLSMFGTPSHLVALQKGFEIKATEVFGFEYFAGLVQKGIAIPLIDATAFEDVSSEDAYSTNARGIKRLNVKGLPEYNLRFEEGHEFYKQLSKMESFKRYDYIIGDAEGNWLLASKSNGNYQGFTAGHTTPELTQRKAEGGDPEYKTLLVQFLDRLQWDRNYDIIHAEDIDITPQEMPLVNGTIIEYTTQPAATDTTLEVSIALASDKSTPVEGIDDNNIGVKVNGAVATVSAVVESTPGNYTITIPALSQGDKVEVEHFDSATSSNVALSNGVLYRRAEGNEALVA